MTLPIVLMLLYSVTTVQAQGWGDLQSVPKEANLRVYEMGGKGWAFADGKLLLVKDKELTILRGGRPLVITRASIARVERRWRDPAWEGALIGTLVGSVMLRRGAGQGCTSPGAGCTIGIVGSYAALGALIDWGRQSRRTVYRAP